VEAAGLFDAVELAVDGFARRAELSCGNRARREFAAEIERQREKHEIKRLLYVALTRARDRLYLATALKDGVMAPGRGSLGEVLPPSIRALFAAANACVAAGGSFGTVTWTSATGTEFEWRVCTGPSFESERS